MIHNNVQLKHSIKLFEKFNYLTTIKSKEREKIDLQKTFEKFPLSNTPYYLTIINKTDYNNNAIFKRVFGRIEKLKTLQSEHTDALSEYKDSPVEEISYSYLNRECFL